MVQGERTLEPSALLRTEGDVLGAPEDERGSIAEAFEKQLKLPPVRWNAHVTSGGKIALADGIEVTDFKNEAGVVRFQVKEKSLPVATSSAVSYEIPRVRIVGLPSGIYRLKVDDQFVLAATSEALGQGVALTTGPTANDAEELRQVVIQRNELFYRRWRPYNDHSRHWGFIGGDFKLYDAEIQVLDKKIAELRQPRVRKIELTNLRDG